MNHVVKYVVESYYTNWLSDRDSVVFCKKSLKIGDNIWVLYDIGATYISYKGVIVDCTTKNIYEVDGPGDYDINFEDFCEVYEIDYTEMMTNLDKTSKSVNCMKSLSKSLTDNVFF